MNDISVQELTNEIAKALEEYTEEVEIKMENIKKEVTRNAVQNLKETSPKGITKTYSKGWGTTKKGSKIIILNKKRYYLTHLLEYGHAKTNGGRVQAKPHIRKVEEETIKNYIEKVKGALKIWN